VRVARETYVLLARFRDDTLKKSKGGAARLPLLICALLSAKLVLRGSLAMMAVTLDVAVPPMVAIMRGRLVTRLPLGGSRTILLSRLPG
jgi:hypothetical protein